MSTRGPCAPHRAVATSALAATWPKAPRIQMLCSSEPGPPRGRAAGVTVPLATERHSATKHLPESASLHSCCVQVLRLVHSHGQREKQSQVCSRGSSLTCSSHCRSSGSASCRRGFYRVCKLFTCLSFAGSCAALAPQRHCVCFQARAPQLRQAALHM